MDSKAVNPMGVRPIFPLILSMSLPAMMSMLVQALYNVVDSYFVAKVSENALTAVSLVFPVQNLLIAVAIGTGVGLNSLISRRLGENRPEDARRVASHGLLLAVMNWLIFAAIGLFFSRPFLSFFTENPEIIEMGVDYMSIVCIASIGLCMEGCIEKSLQATGNMIYPMISQLLGAITNIIFDPIFIFGLLGFPRMGVAGAAIATVMGQIFAMFFLFFILAFREKVLRIDLRKFKFSGSTIREIYSVGFPSILMQSIGSLMTVGMNAILIRFTETAVAFFGVYFKLQSFVFMPVFGLNQGVMPIVGYNYGAKCFQRVRQALEISLIASEVISILAFLLFQFAPMAVVSLFGAEDALYNEFAVMAFRIFLLLCPLTGFQTVAAVYLQAVGKPMKSAILSLARQILFFIPAALILPTFLGVTGVLWTGPVADGLALLSKLCRAVCGAASAKMRLYERNHLRCLARGYELLL